ncbi:hypothetical protein AB0O22_02225 [Streptomyces sp. NPDC091204]
MGTARADAGIEIAPMTTADSTRRPTNSYVARAYPPSIAMTEAPPAPTTE